MKAAFKVVMVSYCKKNPLSTFTVYVNKVVNVFIQFYLHQSVVQLKSTVNCGTVVLLTHTKMIIFIYNLSSKSQLSQNINYNTAISIKHVIYFFIKW